MSLVAHLPSLGDRSHDGFIGNGADPVCPLVESDERLVFVRADGVLVFIIDRMLD